MDEVLGMKLDAGSLLAGVVWGAVGTGFWIYGKKQRSAPPLYGGVALIAVTFLVSSAWWMSLAAVGIIALVWWLSRRD